MEEGGGLDLGPDGSIIVCGQTAGNFSLSASVDDVSSGFAAAKVSPQQQQYSRFFGGMNKPRATTV